MKKQLLALFLPLILLTCTPSPAEKKQNRESRDWSAYQNQVRKLNQEQQAAFDALNELQTNTDQKNHLYSTFPKINQPFYPADKSFEITQSELLTFMKQFIEKHCQNLSPAVRSQLAESSVLAQKKYTVLHCNISGATVDYEKGLPMTDVWVMPNVLGHRDIILMWAKD